MCRSILIRITSADISTAINPAGRKSTFIAWAVSCPILGYLISEARLDFRCLSNIKTRHWRYRDNTLRQFSLPEGLGVENRCDKQDIRSIGSMALLVMGDVLEGNRGCRKWRFMLGQPKDFYWGSRIKRVTQGPCCVKPLVVGVTGSTIFSAVADSLLWTDSLILISRLCHQVNDLSWNLRSVADS